jgi:hypothetical protein
MKANSKMGRPKVAAGDRRSVYHLRLSPNELDRFQKAADREKKPLPEWMRETLTQAAKG